MLLTPFFFSERDGQGTNLGTGGFSGGLFIGRRDDPELAYGGGAGSYPFPAKSVPSGSTTGSRAARGSTSTWSTSGSRRGRDRLTSRSFASARRAELIAECDPSEYITPLDQLSTLLESYERSQELPHPLRTPTRKRAKRVRGEELDHLIARFREGAKINDLAQEFGVSRNTVSIILEREGVRAGRPVRRTDPAPSDIAQAKLRYEAGETLEELSVALDISRPVLREALLAVGVTIRQRGKRQ